MELTSTLERTRDRQAATVWIVDDDDAFRDSLALLLSESGYRVRTFSLPTAFLDACDSDTPDCLLVDLYMPTMDGLSLQSEMLARGLVVSTIFISGFGTIRETVTAIRRGALDFLEKPFDHHTLLRCVEASVAETRRRSEEQEQVREAGSRYAQLTAREKEIMELITNGMSNKAIARQLNISARTVENHRAHIMEKMEASNVADLCRLANLCVVTEQSSVA